MGRSSPQRPAAGDRIFRRRCQDQLVTPQHHVPVSAAPHLHVLEYDFGPKCTQPASQVRTWEQKGLFSYSTGISSSHLGTKRLVFVLNRHLKFSVGNKKACFRTQPQPQVRSWEQNASYLYSTGISSSQLGTKRLVFVLNRYLKFAVGNKMPRISYSSETQTICYKPDIPDCPFISPNSCTSIGFLRPCRID